MTRLPLTTRCRQEMRDITEAVETIVAQSNIHEGVVVVQSPHTTMGLTVNENADPDVQSDMLTHLNALVPRSPAFRHQEDNSDSHIQVSLIGPSLALIVESGRVQLGTWQGIYAVEFDGPRSREVWVQVVGTP